MTNKEQIIIDGVDVSKGNQKYMAEDSPVKDHYSAEINTVNGINLAECVFFTRQFDYGYCELSNDSCNEFQINCLKNKNCHFKQLARKTQECEQKEKEINELHLIIDRLLEASGYDKNISTAEDFEDVYSDIDYKVGLLEELKQECEQIKEKYEALKLENEEGYEIVAELKHECEELKSESFTRESLISMQEKDIDRYCKALEEIEKFAKENDDMLQGYHHEWANNKQILEIIYKAKGEDQ